MCWKPISCSACSHPAPTLRIPFHQVVLFLGLHKDMPTSPLPAAQPCTPDALFPTRCLLISSPSLVASFGPLRGRARPHQCPHQREGEDMIRARLEMAVSSCASCCPLPKPPGSRLLAPHVTALTRESPATQELVLNSVSLKAKHLPTCPKLRTVGTYDCKSLKNHHFLSRGGGVGGMIPLQAAEAMAATQGKIFPSP